MRALPIIRSRTGCFTCRRRKKKCNEEKPVCSGCHRNKLECSWPVDVPAVANTSSCRKRSVGESSRPLQRPHPAAAETVAISPRPPSNHRHISISSSPDSTSPVLAIATNDTHATSLSLTPPISTSPSTIKRESYDDALALTLTNSSLSPDHFNITTPISLFPGFGDDSSDLLSYYLARTANSMGNGSTDVNPFISKLVPLAFSSPLVLQLILAQSASHRQAAHSYAVGNEVAQKYYTDSLRMFRNVVGEYMSGKVENTLILTVGSLILCLTEVARGDVHGTIFDHLKASESMLTLLLNRPASEMPAELSDFLVEYYMHMSAASMISTDPSTVVPTVSADIEASARELIDRGYVGQLSGCWLELLSLIPQVFQLGQRMMGSSSDSPHDPDDIITFGLLQSQIMAFTPPSTVNMDSRLAGLVFKQGVILYLWTILGSPHQPSTTTAHANFISMAVSEAVSLLNQFPSTMRVNTSLCWPLAVIGSCTTDAEVQEVLRQRLQGMIETIGLGNMRETLTLLERVWAGPPEDMSPWKLAKAMQEHQIWISFA